MLERPIRRYAAYYLGWCQAFGEHEGELDETRDLNWLVGGDAVGLIVSPALKKVFMRELLGKQHAHPVILLDPAGPALRLNETDLPVDAVRDGEGIERVAALLRGAGDVHMYLTHHIFYPAGTRILTFSRRRPVVILYKEIGGLTARVA